MDEAQNTPQQTPQDDFSGVWHSEYTYHSTTRNGEFTAQHYVRIYQKDGALIVESIPELNNDYLIMRLALDDKVATGSWQETTIPEGPYGGATYTGAVQYVLSDDRKTFSGKWVGSGQRLEVKTGNWDIRYLAPTTDGLAKPEIA